MIIGTKILIINSFAPNAMLSRICTTMMALTSARRTVVPRITMALFALLSAPVLMISGTITLLMKSLKYAQNHVMTYVCW